MNKVKTNPYNYRKWLIVKVQQKEYSSTPYSSEKNKILEKLYQSLYNSNAKQDYTLHLNKKESIKALTTKGDLYIYLIGNKTHRLAKIGISNNISTRIKSIQTGFPYQLEVISSFLANSKEEEKKIHIKFKKYRLQGEWFTLEPDIISFFEEQKLSSSLIDHI